MDTEIAHSGILGQKWYVRRFQNPDGTLTAAGKARYRKSAGGKAASRKKQTKSVTKKTEQNTPKYKSVSDMTDQEIKDFLARRDLERKYVEAITPAHQKTGKEIAQQYAAAFAKKTADKFVEEAANKISKKVANAIFGEDSGNGNKNDKKANDGNSDEVKKLREELKALKSQPKNGKSSDTNKQAKVTLSSNSELAREEARKKRLENDLYEYELKQRKRAERNTYQ